MNILYGILLAGAIIIGVMVMADRIEDTRTQRTWAQVALVNANASAREGRMAFTIVGAAVFVTLSLLIFAACVVSFNGNRAETQPQTKEVHHYHTERERIIERQTVVYLSDSTRREYYKALATAKDVRYIDG